MALAKLINSELALFSEWVVKCCLGRCYRSTSIEIVAPGPSQCDIFFGKPGRRQTKRKNNEDVRLEKS
jgi:hypothetical protein